MGILLWAILGLVVGALAKWIMPGKDPGGFFITMLIGIAGAVVGGFIGTFLGIGNVNGFNVRSLVIAIAGALLLLAIYRRMKKPKAP
jgi:uncharacterized membrane protein YeaQ/YmgE (transglycosylase-associated protein family)